MEHELEMQRETLMSERDAASFQSIRPRLFGIAYRMLGCEAGADDVVQDTWLRWNNTDRSKVRDAAGFLVTAATRLAINVTQSASARRELSMDGGVGEAVDTGTDPADATERREALEHAALVLLENLSESERTAYVLREAFDYPHRQIAEVLGTSEVNTRQLVTRARGHVHGERRRAVNRTQQRRLLDAFVAASNTGDLATLERVLAR